MKSIAKLKDQARKHEQKEDWKAAIEAYQKVLETEQGESELELELGLFNRIGDLYLRLGETDNAVSYYEQAADKYAEAGFFNNAIALCNKALRHRPNRAQIYLKLSRLSAEQGFTTDARRWILDYAARQVKAGRVDAALDGLGDFVESSADPDVREFLAHHLATQGREEEAAAQFGRAYAERMARGETEAATKAAERARALDPAIDLSAAAPGSGARPGDDDDGLAGLETRPGGIDGTGLDVEDLEGLESAGGAPPGLEDEVEGEELAGFEASYAEREAEASPDELEDADTLGGLETFGAADAEDDLGQADEDAGVGPGMEDEEMEPLPLIEDEAEPLPMLSVDGPDRDFDALEDVGGVGEDEDLAGVGGLEEIEDVWEPEEAAEVEAEAEAEEPAGEAEPFPGLDLGGGISGETFQAPSVDIEPLDLGTLDLGFGSSEEPPPVDTGSVDVDAVLGRARELVGRGLTSEAVRELSLLSGADAGGDVFRAALSVVNEIVRRDPNDLSALERRVEFAGRTEDRAVMVTAYLDLAAALDRSGAEAKAQAMYERALELDPRNADALEALGRSPESVEEHPGDLDTILREMGPATAASRGPVPDEGADPEFAAMLSQFKARVTEHGDAEDAGDHYDLGLAFKEMGLIDEAIAEFQTALNGGEERLKVYEELGQCFVLKNQPNVALKIFSRALQVPHEDPAELLGVYYHLGQCHEELGQREQARDAYEKVLAIDPSFEDVPDRMARL